MLEKSQDAINNLMSHSGGGVEDQNANRNAVSLKKIF